MALDTQLYLVTKDIAIRSGLMQVRYRISDGRFVLDNKDLSRVRFTTDEYISGLEGVTKVSEEEAQTLIAQNGYKMGEEGEEPPTITNETPTDGTEQGQEQEEITNEDVGSVEDVLGEGNNNEENNENNNEEE